MIAFVESAFAHTGQPRHMIVDKAGYFTATAFRERTTDAELEGDPDRAG
jgi:hypothetical protein